MIAVSSDEERFPAAWCDGDMVATSVMEAVSFVTPALERFLVQAVASQMREQSELDLRCREFILDESRHLRMHARLNVSLLHRLTAPPLGLARAESILGQAKARRSVADRLRLVAAFEHVSAILSKHYLKSSGGWSFGLPSAKAVFDRHAREELGHCAVAYDICLRAGIGGRFSRSLALSRVMAGALAYVAVAAPSILMQKTGQSFARCFARVAGFGIGRALLAPGLVGELLWFGRAGFHPDYLHHRDRAS